MLRSGHKRLRSCLTDSENQSLDEPLCRHYMSSVDDSVDFEMMLQDVSSSRESPKLDCPSAQPSLEDGGPQLDDDVVIKTEPPCNFPSAQSTEADSQPVNFSLSSMNSRSWQHTDAASSMNGTPSGDKISPVSSATSTASETDSIRLRKELDEVVATNLALQEELSSRDFHLAQLAEDFFCLHEQFRQLARHFQAVLGDIQPPADQSTVNQTANNHVN